MLFFPIFIVWRKKATPYFIALIQHPILGDYSTGRTQLFWPLTAYWYGEGAKITSLSNIIIEWIFFLTSMATILKTRDARTLFQHHPSNLLLSIPIFTVLLPALLSFPLSVPSELIIPHLTFLTMFTVSVLIDVGHIFKKDT